MAVRVQLDSSWWKKNAPESIANGGVAKALVDVSKAQADLEKSANFDGYAKALEKVRAAITKDEALAKAKKDKEALSLLADAKKAADGQEDEQKKRMTLKEGGSEGGPSAQGGISVPVLAKEAIAMSDEGGGGGGGTKVVDSIVNALDKAWTIIKDNKPDSSAKTSFCQAVPANIPFNELYDWKSNSQSWSWIKENLAGMKVVEAEFHLDYLWNGQTDSVRGLFLNNYNVWCKSIDVAWGFTVNVDATVSGNAYNSGSRDAPVGAIPLLISAQVKGVFQSKATTWKVTCHGNKKLEVG
jgi:hypothetical protein